MLHFRSVVEIAQKVKTDFQEGQISNLHPSYINGKKRKYISDEVTDIAKEFWTKEATIPEPSYRKVRTQTGLGEEEGPGNVFIYFLVLK
jgi:hypothetical protein